MRCAPVNIGAIKHACTPTCTYNSTSQLIYRRCYSLHFFYCLIFLRIAFYLLHFKLKLLIAAFFSPHFQITEDVTRKKSEYQKHLEYYKLLRSKFEEHYIKGNGNCIENVLSLIIALHRYLIIIVCLKFSWSRRSKIR